MASVGVAEKNVNNAVNEMGVLPTDKQNSRMSGVPNPNAINNGKGRLVFKLAHLRLRVDAAQADHRPAFRSGVLHQRFIGIDRDWVCHQFQQG